MDTLFLFYAFVFGLLVGSFLNVLIYRLPNNIPFVMKRSYCPSCQAPIPGHHNIPLVSFMILRGKCRACKAPIPLRYPLVELLTGLASVYFFPRHLNLHSTMLSQSLLSYFFYFSVFCVFLVQFAIDLKHKLLPDGLNIYLALLFLGFGIFILDHPWDHWLLGGVIGFAGPYLITWGYYMLRGKIGLGGGDIKLYGALGIHLGVKGVFLNIFFSCLLGAVLGLLLMGVFKMDKENPIPFGPFIIVVASIQIFLPDVFHMLSGLLF